jgi:putative membrane protein insertion efficiency factor
MNTLLSHCIISLIKGYRYLISPLLQHSCRFEPTCSQYFIDAVQIHGCFKGCAKGIVRILKCHPFTWLGGSAGYDPVQKEKKI